MRWEARHRLLGDIGKAVLSWFVCTLIGVGFHMFIHRSALAALTWDQYAVKAMIFGIIFTGVPFGWSAIMEAPTCNAHDNALTRLVILPIVGWIALLMDLSSDIKNCIIAIIKEAQFKRDVKKWTAIAEEKIRAREESQWEVYYEDEN